MTMATVARNGRPPFLGGLATDAFSLTLINGNPCKSTREIVAGALRLRSSQPLYGHSRLLRMGSLFLSAREGKKGEEASFTLEPPLTLNLCPAVP